MRNTLAMVLVVWTFVAGPAYCLASVDGHGCACAEDPCPDCQSFPCRGSHECHDDPCPSAVCRLEQDELPDISPSLNGQGLSGTSLADLPIALGIPVPQCQSEGLPDHAYNRDATPRHNEFALLGSPLLI